MTVGKTIALILWTFVGSHVSAFYGIIVIWQRDNEYILEGNDGFTL